MHECLLPEIHAGKVCLTYDTELTIRAYDSKGLLGHGGNGRKFRMYKKYDPNTNSCSLNLEDEYVSRTRLSESHKSEQLRVVYQRYLCALHNTESTNLSKSQFLSTEPSH